MCVICAAAAAPSLERALDALEAFPEAPPPFPLDPPIGVLLTWTGVAGFVLERDGVRITFDPFVTRPGLFSALFRRARPDEGAVAATFSGLSAAFVGHTHYDHAMDLPAVLSASPRATAYGGATTVETCRRLGVPAARLVAVDDGRAVDVGPFRVEAVRSRHGVVPLAHWVDRAALPREGVPRTPFRRPRGEVFAWRVSVAGRTLHVQGSAGIDDEALARQAPAEVVVACLAARRGTPRYLERLGDRLRPRVLVPCHHDDFFRPLSEPPRPVPTLRWSAFREEAAELLRAQGTRTWLPPRGVTVAV